MIEKSKTAQIYTLTYKIPEYGLGEDELHTPIQLGKDLHPDVNICDVCDNTGNNISKYNYFYFETTGIYWIWKNVHDVKYVGQEQYRRRWNLKENDIVNLLKRYDIIVPKKTFVSNPNTILTHYAYSHSAVDILTVKSIIRQMYPDYLPAYKEFIEGGNTLYISNMFILPKKEYDKMCEFTFSILDKFREIFNLNSRERVSEHVVTLSTHLFEGKTHPDIANYIPYQSAIGAFLSERLNTLYIMKNFPKRYESEIVKYEGIK